MVRGRTTLSHVHLSGTHLLQGGWFRSAGLLFVPLVLLSGIASPGKAHRLVHSGEIWCQDGVIDEADLAQVLAAVGTACSQSRGCPEDLNHNHYVGASDVAIVATRLGDTCMPADVDGDGDVDADDVTAVLEAQGLDCRADIDRNGFVGEADVAHIEMAFGPAPDPHLATTQVQGDVCTLSIGDLLATHEILGRDCRGDVNRDRVIDGCDAAIVCSQAGACPPDLPACETVDVEPCPEPG